MAMNQCDKVEPMDQTTWDEPNDEQLNSIIKKMIASGKLLPNPNLVVPYSTSTQWNLNAREEEVVPVALLAPDVSFPPD